MAELFSEAWMQAFMSAWNADPELSGALEKINFNSIIGYGFPDAEQPTGVLCIENGKAVYGSLYQAQQLDWDLRAQPEHWQKWMKDGIGMTGLGIAFVSGKLKFKVGDYTAMIKDPRMAPPFVKSFSVMGRVSV